MDMLSISIWPASDFKEIKGKLLGALREVKYVTTKPALVQGVHIYCRSFQVRISEAQLHFCCCFSCNFDHQSSAPHYLQSRPCITFSNVTSAVNRSWPSQPIEILMQTLPVLWYGVVHIWVWHCSFAVFLRDKITLPGSHGYIFFFWAYFPGCLTQVTLTPVTCGCHWAGTSQVSLKGCAPMGCTLSPSMGPFWCCVKAFCCAGFHNNNSLDAFFFFFFLPSYFHLMEQPWFNAPNQVNSNLLYNSFCKFRKYYTWQCKGRSNRNTLPFEIHWGGDFLHSCSYCGCKIWIIIINNKNRKCKAIPFQMLKPESAIHEKVKMGTINISPA